MSATPKPRTPVRATMVVTLVLIAAGVGGLRQIEPAVFASPTAEAAPVSSRAIEPTGATADRQAPSAPASPGQDPWRTGSATDEVLRVAVISDLNRSYGSTEYGPEVHAAIARIVASGPDLVLSTGDMVAGQRAGLDYEAMWEAFHAAVTDPLTRARIPLAVTPGNHDASVYPAFERERSIFEEQWLAHRPRVRFHDVSGYPRRYSFSMGPAWFVSIDSTRPGAMDEDQLRWLRRELRAGDEFAARVVFGHVPLYPFSEGRESDYIGDAALEELLVEEDVSLFLSGHHHAYYPGRRGALRLVGMSCLGAGPRPLIGTNAPAPLSFVTFAVTELGVVDVEAWSGATFTDAIPRSTLPERINAEPLTIWRDDVRSAPAL